VEVGCGASDKAHIAALTRANRSMSEHCSVVINRNIELCMGLLGTAWPISIVINNAADEVQGRHANRELREERWECPSLSFFSAIIGPRSHVPRA
jgi:hypothetical protein